MNNLNVIALVSGGKDSLFSLLHLIANGHRIVALANVMPADEEDANSFMYQTVGHSVVALYEDALGIPLYRQKLVGTVVDANKSYAASDADETESLSFLIDTVKRAHPEANALSSGAILSDYQRTRVESVALRQGLVPIALLWQYDESRLLDDMARVSCDSRIIKVASGGLDDSFLWLNVASSRTKARLETAMRRFGAGAGAILGEGGEYETLAIDGPRPLWKKRIVVDGDGDGDGHYDIVSEGGGAAFLRFRHARVEEKVEGADLENLWIPPLLEDRFDVLLHRVLSEPVTDVQEVGASAFALDVDMADVWTFAGRAIVNVTADITESMSPERQMQAIVQTVESKLALPCPSSVSVSVSRLCFDDCVFATLLLRNMSDFDCINKVYKTMFTKPNPPARAAIACGSLLPDGVDVIASFVFRTAKDVGAREGLHVQSRSYWAPANIGPYSQAIKVPLGVDGAVVYVAGQIPLVPASMSLPERKEMKEDERFCFCREGVLSLQHLWRIGECVKVRWWMGTVAYLAAGEHVHERAVRAWNMWKGIHESSVKKEQEEDENIDVWDLKYGQQQARIVQQSDENAARLADASTVAFEGDWMTKTPPFVAAEISALPRGSDVEWQSVGVIATGLALYRTCDSGAWERCTTRVGDITLQHTISVFEPCRDETVDEVVSFVQQQHKTGEVYTTVFVSSNMSKMLKTLRAHVVPCRSLWGAAGRRLAFAVVVHVNV